MDWKKAIKTFGYFLKIERGLSEKTIDGYTKDLHKLSRFVHITSEKQSPVQIDPETIQLFVYDQAKKLEKSSQARLITSLKQFFSYLIFEGYRQDNPTDLMERPKLQRKLPDTLSQEEVDLIIETVDLSKPEGHRNKAILEVLYSCGLRVSEVVSLQMSDLYFNEGFIKARGKGNKERFVPISSDAIKWINLYIKHYRDALTIQKPYSDVLFLNRRGNKLSRNMVFTIVKQLNEKVGIRKKISPHTFRHSFASHLLQNGADLSVIQQLLGHESITTTEIYLHIDRTKLQEVIQRHHPRNTHN